MKIFIFVSKYLKNYKLILLFFIILCCAAWILSLSIPYITGKFIDILVNVRTKSGIVTFIKVLAAVFVLDILISSIKSIVDARLKNSVSFDLNYSVLEHIKRLPYSYFRGINTGYLTQRIHSDSFSTVFFVIENSIGIFISISTLLSVGLYTFYTSRAITLLILLSLPVYVLIYILHKGPLYKKEYEYKENQNKFFSKLNEQIYKIKLIKINSWFDVLGIELKKSFTPVLKSLLDYTKIMLLYSGSSKALNYIIKIIVFVACGFQVVEGRMTVGELTAISAYFGMLVDCINYFIGFGKGYQSTLVSYNRLKEILYIELEPNGSILPESINEIEVNNLCFSHNKDGKSIFNNFNYKFKKGNIYCISGRNGIGKSTLIDLITGLIHDYKGCILYNSTNIKELDLYSLRKKLIGITEQEPSLFNDTVANNLTYGLEAYKEHKLTGYLNKLNMSDMISNLPEGLNSIIEEKANNMSGGEKQKLSIIRTLLKDSDVYIFDEPVSAMDQDSIKSLKSVFKGLKQDKIIVIISHQDSFLDISDETIEIS